MAHHFLTQGMLSPCVNTEHPFLPSCTETFFVSLQRGGRSHMPEFS